MAAVLDSACTMQCTLHSNVGDITSSAASEPQQDRTFWAKPNTTFSQFGLEQAANSNHADHVWCEQEHP